MAHDYSQFTNNAKTNDNLIGTLTTLSGELVNIDTEIAKKEEELKELKKLRRVLVEEKFPDATQGIEGKFELPDGTLTIKNNMRTSISAENKPAVMQWLVENNYDAIIKCTANFSFGKGERGIFTEFLEHTKKFPQTLNMATDEGVHYQTMQAWVKEYLAEGKVLPDTFGLYAQTDVKLKPKK